MPAVSYLSSLEIIYKVDFAKLTAPVSILNQSLILFEQVLLEANSKSHEVRNTELIAHSFINPIK